MVRDHALPPSRSLPAHCLAGSDLYNEERRFPYIRRWHPLSNLKHMKKWQRKTLQVGGRQLAVWPARTPFEKVNEGFIFATQFDDMEYYHPLLEQAILERESDPQFGLKLFRGACGVKVHHVDRWQSPAANLIHQRALALFSAASGAENPVADMSWANVYRNGDYCIPHSHSRTEASVVYQLTEGEDDDDNPIGGRLSFADPRLESCCNEEPGRVTNTYVPGMAPGTMTIFPSQLMHYVNPYTGHSPRITLSWNISARKISGSPNPGLDRQREKLRA
jgi:hypothetical protein